jgi:hypothetical protein
MDVKGIVPITFLMKIDRVKVVMMDINLVFAGSIVFNKYFEALLKADIATYATAASPGTTTYPVLPIQALSNYGIACFSYSHTLRSLLQGAYRDYLKRDHPIE